MTRADFIVGYLFGRRGARRWRGRERTRPKMPSSTWRAWAIVCVGTGVLGAWLLFRDSDALGWRMLAGGTVGFVLGMYVVETVWERRVGAAAERDPIVARR